MPHSLRRNLRRALGLGAAIGLWAAVVLGPGAGCLQAPPSAGPRAEGGQPMNIVPFGEPTAWTGEGGCWGAGVVWEDARDVFRVVVRFAEGAALPAPDAVRLEYWQSSWPERRIPRDRPSGSGGSGWLDVGDWFNGRWMRADAACAAEGRAWTYTFRPVSAIEFPALKDFAATYRSTLKLRVVSDRPLPPVASLEAYTDSVWRAADLEVEWGGTADREQVWDGRLEVFNGCAEAVRPLSSETRAAGASGDLRDGWRSRVRGRTSGVAARVLYAAPQACNSFDVTVVTVRTAEADRTFSFAVADVVREGHLFLPDFGVVVRRGGDRTTWSAAQAAWREARGDPRRTDLYARVAAMPEQTLARAWGDTPAKGRHYIPLSFEGGNQHFGLDERGCAWARSGCRYEFGLPRRTVDERTLVDGCLPMVVGEWREDAVRYRQTAFVVPLRGVPALGGRIAADEPLVLMVRIEVERAGDRDAEAVLRLGYADGDTRRPMALRANLGVDPAAPPRFSPVALAPRGREGRWTLSEDGGQVACRAALTGGEPTGTLDLAVPQVVPGDAADLDRLRALGFDDAFAAVRDYWRRRFDEGCRVSTPEPMINDFYRAHAAHLLINTERERGGSDRYMARVGTFHYGVFPSESCMMIADLDRRGYHDVAERALETFVHYQGTVGLPGDFSGPRGQFYGAGGYEMGGYNQSHGWVLWCLAEHYGYTRDDAWLRRVAPAIVEGCDWVARERRRMTEQAARAPIRAIERGLLPPGRLEDIGDWRTWMVTNVYSWWGMSNVARALRAVGHPEAPRLLAEADAYHAALVAACTEAMRRSPVVRLRDGRWIPHVPSDLHRRGRSFGWLTETLEGAIHLVIAGAVEPQGRLATWIVQDYEDNLYLSEEFGYRLADADFERLWFSHGGISQQANLLNNPLPYLYRDEPKHFLRAYFNAFAVSYFPDTRMMTEHALPAIGDWRGDHYKSSDEANSAWWLRLMFVAERGDDLWLGAAVPRAWLADGRTVGIRDARTYFGPMSMQLESGAAKGWIRMTLVPPTRNPPRFIRARFRHPDGLPMVRCEVDGRPCDRFGPDRDWVEVPGREAPREITAYYAAP